jgi:signal peptidase I
MTDPNPRPGPDEPADRPQDAPTEGPAEPGPPPATPPPNTPPPSTPAPNTPSRHRRRARKPKRKKAPWWELPGLVALAILIAILVKTFLVQPFYIPSESMEKTLHGCTGCSGDRILVSKIIYDFRDPHPGDIVVFNAPPGWNDEPPSKPPSNPVLRAIRGFGQLIGFVPPDGLVLVKRVIAVGGQTVKGDAAGHVFISNSGPKGPWRMLDEPYVYETGTDYRAKFGPVTVPKGRLWVMGDHRDRSADSRYHCGDGGADGPDNASCNRTAATVPVGDVIGKAVLIAWPPSRWRTLGTPKTFEQASAGLAGAGVLPMAAVGPLFVLARRRRRR